jgi:hypothetical protein
MSGAPYVGPVFALVGFALKQWSVAAKVPEDAARLLRTCRDLLADVLAAWPLFASNPAAQRLQAAVKNTMKLINETIGIHNDSFISLSGCQHPTTHQSAWSGLAEHLRAGPWPLMPLHC